MKQLLYHSQWSGNYWAHTLSSCHLLSMGKLFFTKIDFRKALIQLSAHVQNALAKAATPLPLVKELLGGGHTYAAFRLACCSPHCCFDNDICKTVQVPLTAEGRLSGEQRQAYQSITSPLCPKWQTAPFIQLGSDAAGD